MSEIKPLGLEKFVEEIKTKLLLAQNLKLKYKDYVEDESYYLGIIDALKFVLFGEPLELEEVEDD